MRQHPNWIETKLNRQSPTSCACGKSMMQQLADHRSIAFMPSKGQDKRPFQFHSRSESNSHASRDINLAEKNYHPPTHSYYA